MKWEYTVTIISIEPSIAKLAGHLDRYGKDGWELVAVVGKIAFFKRPTGLDRELAND